MFGTGGCGICFLRFLLLLTVLICLEGIEEEGGSFEEKAEGIDEGKLRSLFSFPPLTSIISNT